MSLQKSMVALQKSMVGRDGERLWRESGETFLTPEHDDETYMMFCSKSLRRLDSPEGLSTVKTWDEPNLEDSPKALWALARKLWLPIFFLVTVFLNWDHPIELAMRSILFLLSTKPSPLSVYLPIEKSLCAKKVEVQDYKFFCLVKIESTGQKYILVGILGGWWPYFESMGRFL
ncbi:hypothetical protein EUGRSUZ_I01763 [Eucalyptus grandis]|uniref:Uncharacterized protein n=2 Tax=Eucalyptus grandis TaxID=71139 RepID=A0ACC3JG03_EUCGR|nr:hypothetical protein EUGRSUZ_I01763 [Eucalyptus grandis]